MAQAWFRHIISGLCIFWNTAGFNLSPLFLFWLCQYCSAAIGVDSHPDKHIPLKRTAFLIPWLNFRGQSLILAKEGVWDCTRGVQRQGHNTGIVNVSNVVLSHSPLLFPFAYIPLYILVYSPACPQLLQLCSTATIHLTYKYSVTLSCF